MISRDYPYAWKHGWRWAWEYLRYRGRVLGFLRTLWYTIVLGHIGEACQECGRPYLLWWADNDLYYTVTGIAQHRGCVAPGLFCLECFDRKASRKGIVLRWKPEARSQK